MKLARPSRPLRQQSAPPLYFCVALVVAGATAVCGQILAIASLLASGAGSGPLSPLYFVLTLASGCVYVIWDKRSRRCWEHPLVPTDSPIAKALKAWQTFAVILGIGLFFYGIVVYTKAPIRPQGAGYVDKGKNPRTRAEYQAFRRWESAMLPAFIAMLWTIGCVQGATQPRAKSKRRAEKK